MIDNPDYIAYGVGGLGLASLIAQGIWTKFFTTEGKASDALVQQLSDRLGAQEQRLIMLEAGLDAERDARRRAEDKVHALEIDNLLLRAELRRHGIDVAAALAPDFARGAPAAVPRVAADHKAGGTSSDDD